MCKKSTYTLKYIKLALLVTSFIGAIFGGSYGIYSEFMSMYYSSIQQTAVRSDFYVRDVFQSGRRVDRFNNYIWVNVISPRPVGNITCVNIPYKVCNLGDSDDCIKTQSQLLKASTISGFIAPDSYPTSGPFCTRIYFDIRYVIINDLELSSVPVVVYICLCFVAFCIFTRYLRFIPGCKDLDIRDDIERERITRETELPPSNNIVSFPESGQEVVRKYING